MASTAQTIITVIRDQINDPAGTYWSDAELLRYLDLGQQQIASLVPEATATETLFTVTQNTPRQEIPADGLRFIKVTANANPSDDSRSGAIRYAEHDALDTDFLDWPATNNVVNPGSTESYFQHYTHDSREPRVFYLYPRPDATPRKVFLVYAQAPATLSQLTDQLSVSEQYNPALVDFGIYRALIKEGRHMVAPDVAARLWGNFIQSLGLRLQAHVRVAPEANRPPEP